MTETVYCVNCRHFIPWKRPEYPRLGLCGVSPHPPSPVDGSVEYFFAENARIQCACGPRGLLFAPKLPQPPQERRRWWANILGYLRA